MREKSKYQVQWTIILNFQVLTVDSITNQRLKLLLTHFWYNQLTKEFEQSSINPKEKRKKRLS